MTRHLTARFLGDSGPNQHICEYFCCAPRTRIGQQRDGSNGIRPRLDRHRYSSLLNLEAPIFTLRQKQFQASDHRSGESIGIVAQVDRHFRFAREDIL